MAENLPPRGLKRFTVLQHDWPEPHYDLLLERDGVLKAWRLAEEPVTFPLQITPNYDHRLLYLDFEGKLEGDRGSVTRWDSGIMTWIDGQCVELTGTKLQGRFIIQDGLLWIK